METPPEGNSIRAILLDIEGTTTPVDFVLRTLFPYARRRLNEFLSKHRSAADLRTDIDALRLQHQADTSEQLGPPEWEDDTADLELASATAYGLWLIDRDSKCSALKSLQGKIWQEGYGMGELRGEVYPDVPVAFARWSRQGKIMCIFSSGSVLAQQLLFGSTAAGDLTRFIYAYFDTTTGPKNAPRSYSQIAEALSLKAQDILFISDILKELDAAQDAGIQTALCVRTESAERIENSHRVIHSFNEVFPGS